MRLTAWFLSSVFCAPTNKSTANQLFCLIDGAKIHPFHGVLRKPYVNPTEVFLIFRHRHKKSTPPLGRVPKFSSKKRFSSK